MKTALYVSLLSAALPVFGLIPSAAAAGEVALSLDSVSPAAAEQSVPASPFGLVYLTDPRGFVVYAYRLSDSSPLPEAELRLLDAGKKQLATCCVKDGLAQGELPAGTRYLQLCCGDDTLLAEACDKVPRAHPDAPNPYTHQSKSCSFRNRRAYRPGDVVRLGGVRREIHNGVMHMPEDRRFALEYKLPGEDGLVQHRQEVELAEDGTWLAEFTLPQDMQDMKKLEIWVPTKNGTGHYLFTTLEIAQEPPPSIRVDGSFALRGHLLKSSMRVTSSDGQPLAGREVRWSLRGVPGLVLPEGYEDYFFGDGRFRWLANHRRIRPGFTLHDKQTLDETGQSHVGFEIPAQDVPQRMILTLSADMGSRETPNGITHRERVCLEPAGLCVGLRRSSSYSKPGADVPVDLLLLHSTGERYEGDAVEVEVVARRHPLIPGKFGDEVTDSWRSREVYCQKHLLPASGASLSLHLEEEGAYDISVCGHDAEGNEFATIVRHYVWGQERAPWQRDLSGQVHITTRMGSYGSVYRPGEMVQLVWSSMVEGTAIIVIEGDEGRHVLTRPVMAGQQAICFPMREEYGVTPTVTLAVVQGDSPRPMHGRPMLQLGKLSLSAAEPSSPLTLNVQLPDAPFRMVPGQQWAFEGCVRDAAGKPLAGASVLLCAQDIGATDVFMRGSYPASFVMEESEERGSANRLYLEAGDVPSLPLLRGLFSQQRKERFYSDFNYAGGAENLRFRGDFIDHDSFGGSVRVTAEPRAQRGSAVFRGESAPAGSTQPALWTRVVADDEGRFRACFTAPNEITEMQIFVIACGQPEQLGVAGVLIPICPESEAAEAACPEEMD